MKKSVIFWSSVYNIHVFIEIFSVLKKKAALHKGMKMYLSLHIQNMFFFPVLWLHHLNDNLKTAHLDISYLQRIAKLWGL